MFGPRICGIVVGTSLLASACGLPVNTVQTPAEKLDTSVLTAASWMRTAKTKTSDTSLQADIDDVIDVLQNREITLLKQGAEGPCEDNTEEEFTLAYVPTPVATGGIYVCAETIDFTTSIIAQVLIHEAIHGAGNTNECSTTQEELNYMTLAGKRPFKNAYVDSTSNPNCSSYNLDAGIDFIILDDGTFVTAPHVVHFIGEEEHAPHGARYVRAKRSTSILQRVLGRNSASWLTQNIFSFFSH